MPYLRLIILLGIAFFCTIPTSYVLANPAQEQSAPVSVVDSIEATLNYNKSLKSIQANRDSLVHELRRAQAGWGPRINVSANAGGTQLNNADSRKARHPNDMYGATGVAVTLTQPVWDGLATYNRVNIAEANVSSIESRVFDNATSLALDALIAHVNVLRTREIFILSEHNIERHLATQKIAETRASMGADAAADSYQTAGRLSRARASMVEARASLIESQDTYTRLTGIPPQENLEPLALPLPDNLYPDITSVLSNAKQSNPKWLAYMYDIDASRGQRKLAESAFHPMINLEVSPSYSNQDSYNSEWTRGINVMGTMNWNIFNSGADAAAVKSARAQVRQSTQFKDDFMDTLTLEIQTTWTNWKSATEQQRHYEDAIVFNQQTLIAYEEQFALGSRPLLDVLDAESELYSSSVQAITFETNATISVYKLFALAGVLLPELKINTGLLHSTP